MTDNLKPCPFCGGEAKTRLDDRWWVHCGNCTCEIGFEGMDENGYYGRFDTEADAIVAWNTRAERTCHVNELDALTQTLSMVNGCSWGECSECGCLTPTDSVFCIECGAKVVD